MSLDLSASTGITINHDTYDFIAPSKFFGSLKGKVVVITGASRGIGRSTALSFAAAGAHVAALARTKPDLGSLVAEIKSKYSVPAVALTFDALSSDLSSTIATVEKELGPIDILVNNAGTTRIAKFVEDKDLDAWWKVFELNVKAPVALIHAVLPSFLSRGSGMTITIGSCASELPLPFMSAYVASKAAIQKAVQILDMELREKGIFNYLIHPGTIKTSLGEQEGVILGPEMQAMTDSFAPYMVDTLELAADSLVALAAYSDKGEATFLSGRYWDVQEDLGQILEKKQEIEERSLYVLKIKKL
ncbi:Short chain dehydrogenase mpl6 [Hyphodiscus hymeniophilus]|uniref:Short chain dehydrogenase mpl6 n=1 Tax=Hyphodiscus hymeniophilus TaxID=353542 RepID=A0A9P7AVK8_9HELO|nr:Short chain dehydrogenase mpl6 [Hyphodiscus hymeniophilus]